MLTCLRLILVIVIATIGPCCVLSQGYPTKPVRVLVGFGAGSPADILARAVSTQLGSDFGQQFYVENQTGANSTIAIGTVVRASPDGYTLHFNLGSIAPIPYIYKSLRYDILKDLIPIATVGILDGFLMVVHPAVPARTVADFIAYAKKNHVVFGSPGVGSTPHLAAEIFKLKAGIDMSHVPFRGGGDASVALLSKSIEMMFVSPSAVLDLVKSGDLRAIALSGSRQHQEVPDVPLMKVYLPDYPINRSWGIYFAPASTPSEIIETLNVSIRKAVRAPAVANVLQRIGYYPDERSSAQTAEFFRQEVEAAGEAVRAAKILPN